MRIALIVVASVLGVLLLLVGSCVGCAAFVVSAVVSIGEYRVDKMLLEERYGDDLSSLESWLADGRHAHPPVLSEAFRAVFLKSPDEIGFADGEELLGRVTGLSASTYVMTNQTGYAEVSTPGQPNYLLALCKIRVGQDEYIVCIKDKDLLLKRQE